MLPVLKGVIEFAPIGNYGGEYLPLSLIKPGHTYNLVLLHHESKLVSYTGATPRRVVAKALR